MNKWIKYLSMVLITVIGLPGLIYLGLAIYYQDSFMYGTWINGIYCTGKTVEQVGEELTEAFNYDKLNVITPQGVEVIAKEEFDFSFDFDTALEEYRRHQNSFGWFLRILTGHQNQKVIPTITFNEEKLEEWFYHTKSYQENLNLSEDSLAIVLTEEGYCIEEKKEKILNTVLATEKIKEAVLEAKEEIDLEKEECYFTREETVEMQETRELYEAVKNFQNISLTYKIKEVERKVMPCEIAKWLATDENGEIRISKKGSFVLDRKAIEEFVAGLARDYDTWKNYNFITHDGKEITIDKGNYGIQIHQDKEVNFLINYLKEPVEVVREPVYLKDVTFEGRNRIDTTYVEIDLTAQKMFYFENSNKILETDVVTGCVVNGTDTPEMVCYVYSKSEDAILKGKNYRSHVNYWMPVYGGIGIHDATWRDEFGGDIYLKSGSHGCVNTPLEIMGSFYEMVQKGTPVVLHY